MQDFYGDGYFSVFSRAMSERLRPFTVHDQLQWLAALWPEVTPPEHDILYCRRCLPCIDHERTVGERSAKSGLYNTIESLVLNEFSLSDAHGTPHIFRLEGFPRLLIVSEEAKAACEDLPTVGFTFVPVQAWSSATPQRLVNS